MVEIYELAYRLHMPVYKLNSEMPYEELLGWFEYFKMRPVGWQEDQRISMLLQAQGVKEKPEKLFPTLKALKENRYSSEEKRVASTLVNSGFFAKLQTAASSNNIQWEVSLDQDATESPKGT